MVADYGVRVVHVHATCAAYIGCYKETDPRRLPDKLFASQLTLEQCRDLAAAGGYKYFGAQWQWECWGGNNLQLAVGAGLGVCDMPCGGNSLQICGQGWVNSVYKGEGDYIQRICTRWHQTK